MKSEEYIVKMVDKIDKKTDIIFNKIDDHNKIIHKIDLRTTKLELKATFWGALAGILVTVANAIIGKL